MRYTMSIFSRVLWALVLVASSASAGYFCVWYLTEVALRDAPDVSAPQLAAVAGAALVVGILPYVIARAFDEMRRPITITEGRPPNRPSA